LLAIKMSSDTLKCGMENNAIGRLPAAEIECAVIQQIRVLLRSPEMIVRTWRAARKDAIERFDDLWEELFSAEQSGIVQLFVERIDVIEGAADIRLRADGLTTPPRSSSRLNTEGSLRCRSAQLRHGSKQQLLTWRALETASSTNSDFGSRTQWRDDHRPRPAINPTPRDAKDRHNASGQDGLVSATQAHR
jgi:hypothetical protein